MIRLHLGCGNHVKPGWLNCDRRGGYQGWEETELAARIVELDLTQHPYPFADGSVGLVTVSHCLNQIEPSRIPDILSEAYRILEPGGILRITDDDVESPESPVRGLPHFHALWPTGPASMSTLLREAGFRTHVVSADLTISTDPSIVVAVHEAQPAAARFFVEAVKPHAASELDAATAASAFQLALNHALSFFLVASNADRPTRLRGAAHLPTELLQRVAAAWQAVTGPLARWPLALPPLVTPNGFATHVALGYRLWGDVLAIRRATEPEETLPLGSTFDAWVDAGGSAVRFEPVRRLRAFLQGKVESEAFLRAVVHGSVATLDDAAGFSDLDLAFVLRRQSLENAAELVALRRLMAQVLVLTYAFDPYMHHGPHILAEHDLNWYPNPRLPSVVFAHAVELLERPELPLRIRPAPELTDRLLDLFEEFFEHWRQPLQLRDTYELEWVVGSTTILPALYLQRQTGQFHYKRDTFEPARRDFTAEEWEPIRRASELRLLLGERPRPAALLVEIALRLRASHLLRRWARRSRANRRRALEATSVLGDDFTRRVGDFIRTARAKLAESSSGPEAGALPNRAEPDRATGRGTTETFDQLVLARTTNWPEPTPAGDYARAAQEAIERWTAGARPPLAIYQLGSLTAPGISDLDFVVVVRDGERVDQSAFDPESTFGPGRRLMTHPPYVCTEAAFADVRAWYPIFSLEHRWGASIEAVPIEPDEEPGVAFGMLVDYLAVKLPSLLLRIAWQQPLDVRTLLGVTHSARHTFALATRAGLELPPGAATVVAQIDELRGDWFALDRDHALAALVTTAAATSDAVGRLTEIVDAAIRERADVPEQSSPRRAGSGLFAFASPWSYEAALGKAAADFARDGWFAWTTPLSFSGVLGLYGHEHRGLRRYLRGAGAERVGWDGGRWADGLRRHARAMARYGESAAGLGVEPQVYVALAYTPPPGAAARARFTARRGLSRLRRPARRLAPNPLRGRA